MLLGVPLVEMLGVVNKIGCLRCTNQMRGKGCELENTVSVCFFVLTNKWVFFFSGKRMWTVRFFWKESSVWKTSFNFQRFFWVCRGTDTWPHGELGLENPTQLAEASKHSVICPTRSLGCDCIAEWCWQPPTKKHQIALCRQVEEYKLRDVSSQCDDKYNII